MKQKSSLLFLLVMLSLGFSQAYSQGIRYLTPRYVEWGSDRAFVCDTFKEETAGAGIRIDGVHAKDGGLTLSIPLPVASGGTGTGTLASGYVSSTGNELTSSSSIPGSDISGNISGSAAGLTSNIPISRTTGLQDSITAVRTTALKGHYYAIDNLDGTVTGTMTETILCNVQIAAGDMGANDVLKVEAFMYAVGTNGTKNFKVYIGPNSNSLSGAIQIGAYNFISSNLSGEFVRKIVNKGSTSTNVCYPPTQPAGDPYAAFAGVRQTTNINFSNTQYVMVTCTLGAVADVGGLSDIELYIFKPRQ